MFAALLAACALQAAVIFSLQARIDEARAQICALAAVQHAAVPGCPRPLNPPAREKGGVECLGRASQPGGS